MYIGRPIPCAALVTTATHFSSVISPPPLPPLHATFSRDGALAFSRRVARLRLALAIARKLIVLCRRRAKSFAHGAHVRAIAVTPVSFEKLVENFADANTGFVQLGLRRSGSPTQYGSDFLVFITVNVMKEQGLSKALGQF
jgi:hypothetical protein